jgi:hypothetical protein
VTEQGWHSHVHGLLCNPAGRVLLLETERGAALPRVDLDGYPDNDLERARRALAELLGARIAILRYVLRDADRERKLVDVVYELELLEGDRELPAGASWVEADAVPEEHREIAERHLDERRDGVPALRPPWARAGWLAQATAWIESSLSHHGRAPTGPVEQLRCWALSAVLRVPTAEGAVFFKATAASPLFVVEGSVMSGLARLYARNVPEPLAVDASRRWMLLDGLGPAVGWSAPVEEREAALRTFGHLQVGSADHVDDLLAMGCVDRRPEWLARETRALLADDRALAGLEEEEISTLRALEPRLVELIRRLAEGPVPSTVVHGDLHLENVARRDGEFVFFDWTDACVAHPFLDLIDVAFEEDSAVRDRLRDAYLTVWTDHCSQDKLLELWTIAVPLASLNQAVSYRHILANVEPGSAQELEWALPFWLRKVLLT